ncbi:MAG: hypothetical protein ABUL60_18905 [Myxococcales bacterium]
MNTRPSPGRRVGRAVTSRRFSASLADDGNATSGDGCSANCTIEKVK